jgi:hypothetical protein
MKHIESAVGVIVGLALLALILLQRRRMSRHMRDDQQD